MKCLTPIYHKWNEIKLNFLPPKIEQSINWPQFQMFLTSMHQPLFEQNQSFENTLKKKYSIRIITEKVIEINKPIKNLLNFSASSNTHTHSTHQTIWIS